MEHFLGTESQGRHALTLVSGVGLGLFVMLLPCCGRPAPALPLFFALRSATVCHETDASFTPRGADLRLMCGFRIPTNMALRSNPAPNALCRDVACKRKNVLLIRSGCMCTHALCDRPGG